MILLDELRNGMFSPGDLVVALTNGHIFSVGNIRKIDGNQVGTYSIGEYAIVIEASEKCPDKTLSFPNEHTIRILTKNTIGWTWRGFFKKVSDP